MRRPSLPGGKAAAAIDWPKIDRMLAAGCDKREVCRAIGMHLNTLSKRCKKEKGCTFATYAERGMGRPLVPIDWDQVKGMLQIMCTQAEIASVLGVHIDTLNNRCKSEKGCTFSEFIDKNREFGKVSLRRQMWKRAHKNDSVLIFMSKNFLGMADRPEDPANEEPGQILRAIRDELKKGVEGGD